MYGYRWKAHVPVAQRRTSAEKLAVDALKRGKVLSPVRIVGRVIATSFWGRAWCDNLESYADFDNRLPRGRTYARNGSVIDLQIGPGRVDAKVQGSSTYTTTVTVNPLDAGRWRSLVAAHASQVASVVDLLQGELPKSLLAALADRSSHLFPEPAELAFSCSCPDWATMCKHVAAVLYGVGNRLDAQPELFFHLRGVDVADLAASGAMVDFVACDDDGLGGADLGAMFGIDLDDVPVAAKPAAAKKSAAKKSAVAKKPAVAKKAVLMTAAELDEVQIDKVIRGYWTESGLLIARPRSRFEVTAKALKIIADLRNS